MRFSHASMTSSLSIMKGEAPMIARISLFLSIFILIGCAGVQTIHQYSNVPLDKTKRYVIFPFKDPSYGSRVFPGVGSRFTSKFSASCADYGLNVLPVFNERFQSKNDINILDALAFANKIGADFIITGQVTKWIDGATDWSGKRDFAAFSIYVRKATTGNIIFSSEIQEYSNVFWSGTPDDFIDSLAKAMAKKLLARPTLVLKQ